MNLVIEVKSVVKTFIFCSVVKTFVMKGAHLKLKTVVEIFDVLSLRAGSTLAQ